MGYDDDSHEDVSQILLPSKLMQWHTAMFLTILILQNDTHSK